MTIADVLKLVRSGKLSDPEAQEAIAALQPTSTGRPLKLKVSEKGAVSLYGLNAQWPTTLYGDQWERLFGFADTIKKFLADNKDKLSRKAA